MLSDTQEAQLRDLLEARRSGYLTLRINPSHPMRPCGLLEANRFHDKTEAAVYKDGVLILVIKLDQIMNNSVQLAFKRSDGIMVLTGAQLKGKQCQELHEFHERRRSLR